MGPSDSEYLDKNSQYHLETGRADDYTKEVVGQGDNNPRSMGEGETIDVQPRRGWPRWPIRQNQEYC